MGLKGWKGGAEVWSGGVGEGWAGGVGLRCGLEEWGCRSGGWG